LGKFTKKYKWLGLGITVDQW